MISTPTNTNPNNINPYNINIANFIYLYKNTIISNNNIIKPLLKKHFNIYPNIIIFTYTN